MEKLRYNLFYSLANVRENILHGYSDWILFINIYL
jgi:hypothetical protein